MDALFANWNFFNFLNDLKEKRTHRSENDTQNGRRSFQTAKALSAVGIGTGFGVLIRKSIPLSAVGAALAAFMPEGPFTGTLTNVALAASHESDLENSRSEPKTGLSFPIFTENGLFQLTGLGVRNKVLFGLKNLKIYAFGVYVNPINLLEKLGSKYGSSSVEKLTKNPWLFKDLISSDVELSVRLTIYYRGLKIGQVRHAFEDSLGSRIKQISGSENPSLLNAFTSQFKDDFKLERGTVIEITRKPGHVLVTKIGGKEVGTVKSALMGQAFFDLYIGENPFDKNAKEEVAISVADLLSKA